MPSLLSPITNFQFVNCQWTGEIIFEKAYCQNLLTDCLVETSKRQQFATRA